MLHKFAEPLEPFALDQAQDYDRVRRAIEFLSKRWRRHPGLEEIAAHVGLSPSHFHHLFRRWAGITPKDFIAALTLDQARRLIKDSASLMDASFDLGLSGPGRLHDLFVTHEAMSPGEWKSGGAGLTLRYGFHDSPFGEALAVMTGRGLAGLGWVDDKPAPGTASGDGKPAGGRAGALADMKRRWPRASFVEDQPAAAALIKRSFDTSAWHQGQKLKVVLIGTDFEVRVWQALLKIPPGRMTTYGDVAQSLGMPKAARAVGAAVGRNPVSFVVPCHRVIGKSGALTGYHWGLTRKQAILGWEACQFRS